MAETTTIGTPWWYKDPRHRRRSGAGGVRDIRMGQGAGPQERGARSGPGGNIGRTRDMLFFFFFFFSAQVPSSGRYGQQCDMVARSWANDSWRTGGAPGLGIDGPTIPSRILVYYGTGKPRRRFITRAAVGGQQVEVASVLGPRQTPGATDALVWGNFSSPPHDKLGLRRRRAR